MDTGEPHNGLANRQGRKRKNTQDILNEEQSKRLFYE